jgi:glycosyltransferase involved in cell wall biosynthesis
MSKISVISPIYKAEKIVDELVTRILFELKKLSVDYEIILVDDGSPDGSWAKIEGVCEINSKVKGIKLSRNFGQHYAITAGIQESSGDYVIVMDCDLQDDPIYFAQLFKIVNNGVDIVYTSKEKREHGIFKNFSAYLFTFIFNFLADNQTSNNNIGNFSIISRKVADAFLSIRDCKRHYLMILNSLGFNSKTILIKHSIRYEGKSSYTFNKLIRHAMDGITFNSTKLLWFSIKLGFVLCLFSCFFFSYILFLFFYKNTPPGYASIMAGLIFSTGILLTFMGIIGIYIGNIFVQVKNRPLYIVDKIIN